MIWLILGGTFLILEPGLEPGIGKAGMPELPVLEVLPDDVVAVVGGGKSFAPTAASSDGRVNGRCAGPDHVLPTGVHGLSCTLAGTPLLNAASRTSSS